MNVVVNPSRVSTDPLLSCIATLYTLILLYFPCTIITTSLFLVLILTSLLLLLLLRLGSSHKPQLQPSLQKQEQDEEEEEEEKVGGDIHAKCQADITPKTCTQGWEQNRDQGASFVWWNVGAPLEVIYEDHHEGGEIDHLGGQHGSGSGLERYPSLSMYFPETDSDSSSDDEDCSVAGDWDSHERVCFRWEEEEEEEEEEEDRDGSLIEIALNRDPGPAIGLDFYVEEDNLIEIDIL